MEEDANPSFKHKLCFSCCFRRRNAGHIPLQHSFPSPSDDSPVVVWVKTKGPRDHSLSEIKDKCRTVLGLQKAKHKRQSSVEFRYDPLSYALNFEDAFDCDDEAPLKSFSARFPPIPAAAN